jgi:type VI secretion system secreted protein VgrG
VSNALQLALRGNRPDYVFGSPLEGWDGPPVVRFSAREGLSRLFGYDIVLRRLVDEGPFPAHKLLNGPGTLRIATEERWRHVHGLVSEVEELDRTPELELFRVRLVPAFWRATQRVRSRTFVDQTLRDILVHVLENRSHVRPLGHGGLQTAGARDVTSPREVPSFDSYEVPEEAYRLDVAEPKRLDDALLRAFTVQYEETDYDFFARLCEEEGLTFVFDQHEGGSVLRVTDHPDWESPFASERTLSFRNAFKGVGARDRESVRSLRRRTQVRWGHVEVRDFDPLRPQSTELGVALDTVPRAGLQGAEVEPDGEVFLERRYPSRDEGTTPPCVTPATLAQERKAALRNLHEAIGTHRGVVPGLRFKLVDDTGVRGDHELVCVSTVVFATQLRPEDTALDDEPFGLAGRGHDGAIFECAFEVLPASVRFRPGLATPRPRIDGVQTAIVSAEEVGSPPPEIHRNARGDVRVRFPWDERIEEGRPSSTWVRVSQGWAGAGYGQLFTPRVGHEVLVAFLNGDPDRPLVVGRVHDAIQPVEYEKPTISTIKTRSSPDSDGFNELRFDDEAAKEEIFLHAQRNLNETVLANHSTSVGGDQGNSVGGNQANSVSGRRTHQVAGTEDVTVSGDRTTTFESAERHDVMGMRGTVIHGFERAICKSSRMTTVKGVETLAVVGTRETIVTAMSTESVGGPRSVESPICLHSHSSTFVVEVGGSKLTMVPGMIRLATPGASILLAGDAITIDCATFTLTAGGKAALKAGAGIDLEGGPVINGTAGEIKLNG